MLDPKGLKQAIQVLNDHGIAIFHPDDGDMDDCEREVFDGFCAGITAYLAAAQPGWRPIEEAMPGEYLLYFPAEGGRHILPSMMKVDKHPVHYPRKPTHFMPFPAAPAEGER